MSSKKPSLFPALCPEVAGPAEPDPCLSGADPMSNVLPFVPSTGPHVWWTPGRDRAQLLGELITMNEEMIEQLRVEQASEAGTAGFLGKMIAQHERAAALLRSQLSSPGSGERS